jgi:hypothetical protein
MLVQFNQLPSMNLQTRFGDRAVPQPVVSAIPGVRLIVLARRMVYTIRVGQALSQAPRTQKD